jgi:hypothetical protein
MDCSAGTTALCAEHDKDVHDCPHTHRRQAIVGFPYRQTLRPSQRYQPESSAWQDVRLYHSVGADVKCSCVGRDPQWRVSEASLQAAPQLILITSFGEVQLVMCINISQQANQKHVLLVLSGVEQGLPVIGRAQLLRQGCWSKNLPATAVLC